MRFWDSSALVPLFVQEPNTDAVAALLQADPDAVVWWSTPVECASALARLEREGSLDAAGARESFDRLNRFVPGCFQVEPIDEIREVAQRLLRVHPLRAADALQLAAAFVAAERRPPTLPLVTLDDRLAVAASKEGFLVVQPVSNP